MINLINYVRTVTCAYLKENGIRQFKWIASQESARVEDVPGGQDLREGVRFMPVSICGSAPV